MATTSWLNIVLSSEAEVWNYTCFKELNFLGHEFS